MFTGIVLLLIALLCLIGIFRQAKERNFFGAGYALISCAVLGWFSVMTLYNAIFVPGGGVPVGG